MLVRAHDGASPTGAQPPRAFARDSRLLRGRGPDLGPTALRFPVEERTLLHTLDAQVHERPNQDWLVFDGRERLTFAEAQAGAYRFATALRERGLAGSGVALFMRNQREFTLGFLGAQAAGGVAVPLNPQLRGPLLATMIARAKVRVVVASADLVDRLADIGGLGDLELVVCTVAGERREIAGIPLVDFDAWLASASAAPPASLPRSSEPGALMFTSGTSGGSKAAVCSHHYLYLFAGNVVDSMEFSPDDVLSTPLQMCHVAGLQVFAHASLLAGCTCHLKSAFSVRDYWHDIAADGATFSMLMGQMASLILREVPEAPPHRLAHAYILPQPQEREEFERRYGTKVIWQGWGMTEVFPHVPRKERLEDVPADTIGPAPAWFDYGVVDAEDRMLGPGELGEMVYRPLIPDGMARGYFADPEATSNAFRNFLFHTGDLGYYDEQGHIHFVMRKQDAIRRKGENISAVELENIARGHPAVDDAAAYAVPAELAEHEVKLDLVCAEDVPLADVHAWLVQMLPRFMVPRYLERRETFPKTPSQRVEKYKLAAEPLDRATVHVFATPRRDDSRRERVR
jgi:crotonobetaine/carnitine-CoA ligase